MVGNQPRSFNNAGTFSSSWNPANQQEVTQVSTGETLHGEPSFETLKQMFEDEVEEDVLDLIWQESISPSAALEALMAMGCRPKDNSKVATASWSSIVSRNNIQPFVTEKQFIPAIVKDRGIVDVISEKIQKGEKILILMRGVSGSGKSYLASQLKGGGAVLSTDDYFINTQGKYAFNPTRLSEAHEWNHRRAEQEMKFGTNPVIIDNTNLEAWEMQPYICMAIRANYVIELVEPETSWKYDIRTLVYKTRHNVPKDKIRLMLEKVKYPINMKALVEECRMKMFRSQPALELQQPPMIIEQNQTVDPIREESLTTTSNYNVKPQRNSDRWNQFNGHDVKNGRTNDRTDWESCQWDESSSSALPQAPRSRWMSPKNSNNVNPSSFSDAAVQTSNSDSSLRTLLARNRDINLSKLGTTASAKKTTPPSSKLTLEKGCMTESVEEDSTNFKGKLATLRSYFAAANPQDLADVLDKCQGDLDWAVGLLIDSGYQLDPGGGVVDGQEDFDEVKSKESEEESAEETPCRASEQNEEEANDLAASATEAINVVEDQEQVEALRKHVEDCFVLTDTISDQARRICGKEYSQFRACQIQKLRQPQSLLQEFAPFNPEEYGQMGGSRVVVESPLPSSASSSTEESDLGKSEEETDAMVPFVMDSTFAQHLASLFGQPNVGARLHQQQQMSFEIPWALAEQIYLHWVSHLMDHHDDQDQEKDSEQIRNLELENTEFKDIIDFEYAMQRAQEEKNAERQQLRESMATKLSLSKLHDTYPNVDRLALDALFEENNYNYDHTVTILEAWLDDAHVSKTRTEVHQPVGGARPRRFTTSAVTEAAPVALKTGARDLRSEAFMYNKLRQDYQIKAQQNYQRGMSSVAAYYASESRRYLELYKEANQKAALQIVEEKNAHRDDRTIDLHELKVGEALSCLESFLVQNIRAEVSSIQVITGKGNHNVDGRPRIKPAVVTFLKKRKYGYEEINPGCLRVYLPKPSVR